MLTLPSEEAAETDSNRGVQSAELSIGGMHCGACATRIQDTLAEEPGVVSASVNLATNKAFVTYDSTKADLARLCDAVGSIGYSARRADAPSAYVAEADTEHWAQRALISWPLAIVAILISVFAPQTAFYGWVVLLLAVTVEIAGGWPFLRSAAIQLRHGATSMDTLIAIGTLAALAVSAVEAIALGGRHLHLGGGGQIAARLHGVMAPFIIAILVTGRAIEARMRARAARAMHSLLSLRPPLARVVASPDDHEGTPVPPESVPVGALLRVRSGEVIPLDSVIVEGWSAIDESMLTGEPLPVEHGPGEPVTGGTTNGGSVLVVKVTKIASESVLAGLQRLVEEAQQHKPPLQQLADRVSRVFVPAVLALAALTFVLWWFVDDNLGTAVLSALAVLLVACPCAMGLATPVAMMVGTGRASALGILVRSGDALERLARVDEVAFDKTGTLTERFASVTHVEAVPGTTSEEVLALAAAVEVENDHPIAAAIRNAAAGTEPAGYLEAARDVKVVHGQGVFGTVGTHEVSVGRLSGQALAQPLVDALSNREARGETTVAVERDREIVGIVSVATPLRPEARPAVDRLHHIGLRTALLSGDGAAAVGTAAASVGIGTVRAELSPSAKLDALSSIQASGHKVMMVGDGVNDAPALAAADVGCAIGTGSEAAVSNSDVALLGSDLRGVPAAIGVARSTSSIIVQNLGWAMGYNAAALPLAATGLLDPLVAAVAMGLSSLIVVLNSLRLLRLGSSGVASVRAPALMRGWRALAVSVALPVVLFFCATLAAQAVSPAKGQSLLPTLPTITDVTVAPGTTAEVYLDPGRPGVNQFHVIFVTSDDRTAVVTSATASSGDGKVQTLTMRFYSRSHYLAYTVLAPGTWRFDVNATIGAKPAHFEVTRTLS